MAKTTIPNTTCTNPSADNYRYVRLVLYGPDNFREAVGSVRNGELSLQEVLGFALGNALRRMTKQDTFGYALRRADTSAKK